MKITHYLASTSFSHNGFHTWCYLVIVGNGGRVGAERERQACLSRSSRVDARSTHAFVYSAADRKLLQVVIGCNDGDMYVWDIRIILRDTDLKTFCQTCLTSQ